MSAQLMPKYLNLFKKEFHLAKIVKRNNNFLISFLKIKIKVYLKN